MNKIIIYANHHGNIEYTQLWIGSEFYETTEEIAWEGDIIKLNDKLYTMENLIHNEFENHNTFEYLLEEIGDIKDLTFMIQ